MSVSLRYCGMGCVGTRCNVQGIRYKVLGSWILVFGFDAARKCRAALEVRGIRYKVVGFERGIALGSK